MPIETIITLIDALRDSRVLDDDQLRELEQEAPGRFQQPKELAKDLVTRGWLTRYQAKQILHGHGSELTLGPYRLLERIGEGGMGQVYRALHMPMNRIVALKVIRPELVAEPRALKRFRREVQAAAHLSHPNIVTVFDAAQVGEIHFLAMEYINGADLTDLVRQGLPIAAACDYIRQAALGLQHAHERGLIHRDIKPANILITREPAPGIVKILDMGLARPAELNLGSVLNSTSLTMEGTVVGTPDFMSPEQAKNSHTVDHRGDIYSLGCTLYYALTGRLPFPKGSAMEKLLKHQLEDPFPVEKARPEVPAGLPDVLRKMLAKMPEERYQSGGEVAAALAPFCESGSYVPIAGAGRPRAPSSPSSDGNAAFRFDTSTDAAPTRAQRVQAGSKRRFPVYVMAGVGAALLGVIILAAVLLAAGKWNDPEHPTAKRTDKTDDKIERPAIPDRVANPPHTLDAPIAASIQDGAAFAAVVNLRQLASAAAFEKHILPALQPVLQVLATRQIDPRKQWEHAVVSLDGDTQSRVLVVVHTATPIRPLIALLGQTAPPQTMAVDERTTFTFLELADLDKGKPAYLAPLGEKTLALASDPELLRQATARFQGRAKEVGNDFLLQQLARTKPEASLRVVILGRLALGSESFSAYGIRSFAGELTLTDAAELEGQARIADLDTFSRGWRKLKQEMILAGLFDVRLSLPATLVTKATAGAPATDGGYVHVHITSRLTATETDMALKGISGKLGAGFGTQTKNKSKSER